MTIRMKAVRCSYRLLLLCVAVLAAAGDVGAATIVDDDFDDGTGTAGVPAGWTELMFGSAGSVVESPSGSPSAVVINDPREAGGGGPTGMISNSAVDTTVATATAMTISLDSLTGTDNERRAFFGYVNDPFTAFWIVRLKREDASNMSLEVQGGAPGGGSERSSDLGNIAYDGTSSLELTFIFDNDSFRVQTDAGFDSGDKLYSNSFVDSGGFPDPTFNPLTGLGASAFPAIVSSAESNDGDTSILQVDRINVAGVVFVPEPSTFLLAALGLPCLLGWGRRRIRRQAVQKRGHARG